MTKQPYDPEAVMQYTLPQILVEDAVESCTIKGQTVDGGRYVGTRLRRVVFQNCRFSGADFTRCELIETRFVDCDLSGADFSESFWENSLCRSVKGIGLRMSDSYLVDTTFEDCLLRYVDLSRSKWKGGALLRCDLREGFLNECKLLRFRFEDCDLTRTEIVKTPLSGLNLSDCTIDGLICSDSLSELRGALIDPVQAVEIVRRLGIVVK